jgi:hypothetical protein
MKSGHWIPEGEQDLVDLLARWDEYLSSASKRTEFGWDVAECSSATLKIGNFLSARLEYHANNSSGNLFIKNAARKAVVAMMRDFANSSIRYNKKMTDADKLYLGIKKRASHNAPQPAPIDHVSFVLRGDAQAHAVWADYRIDGSVGHSKGRYHGVEVRFWTLALDATAPPTADEPAWRSEVDTATPWSHTFGAHEIGMRLYVSMRWENKSVGKDKNAGKGPWSAIQGIVIA